jgi:pimeloyl-ACP methyl ester carboxylesterase
LPAPSTRLVALAVALAALAAAAVARERAQASAAAERFIVQSDGHPMAVWSRRPPQPRGVVILIHGRTWSSLPDFDLQVPGRPRSVMASLAGRGLATYAVDLRGYGQTPPDPSGWLTPRRSASDLLNVIAWVASRHPQLPPPALIGWSRGAMVAQMVAQVSPARVAALVLFGFAYDPDARFIDVAVPARPLRDRNTRAAAVADFISPEITPPEVIEAFATQALEADPILADLKGDGEFNALDPAQVTVPTLVLYGSRDPGVLQADAARFFVRLATPDKQMVVLPGADHAAQIENSHDAWIAAVMSFLNRPPVR